jgi:hypothetical protein
MIYLMAENRYEAEKVAFDRRLRPWEWIHLVDPRQLAGREEPRIVRLPGAERRLNYRAIIEVADNRSARFFTEFDLQEGKVK